MYSGDNSNNRICLGCMRVIGNSYDVCPECGYARGSKAELPFHLQPGSYLSNRFLIGKELNDDGRYIDYVAYDTVGKGTWTITELFPRDYAERGMEGQVLTDLGPIRRFDFDRNNFIKKVSSISTPIYENNTVYIIRQYSTIPMSTLIGDTPKKEYSKKSLYKTLAPNGVIASIIAAVILAIISVPCLMSKDEGIVVLGIVILMFLLIPLIIIIRISIKWKRFSSSRMVDQSLKDINENTVFKLRNAFFTKDFIYFNDKENIIKAAIQGILWIYKSKRTVTYYHVVASTEESIVLHLIDGNKIEIGVTDWYFKRLCYFLKYRNPNIIFGYTKEAEMYYKNYFATNQPHVSQWKLEEK